MKRNIQSFFVLLFAAVLSGCNKGDGGFSALNQDSNPSPTPKGLCTGSDANVIGCGAPSPRPSDDPVDKTCKRPEKSPPVFVKAKPLKPINSDHELDDESNVACLSGFELNNFTQFVKGTTQFNYDLKNSGQPLTHSITLDLDVATYNYPDRIQINEQDAAGNSVTIFDTCVMKTAQVPDPTSFGPRATSGYRPFANMIRQYHLKVDAGTTRLNFFFGGVESPMYIRVVGLCKFAANSATTQLFHDAIQNNSSKNPRHLPFKRDYNGNWNSYPTQKMVPLKKSSEYFR